MGVDDDAWGLCDGIAVGGSVGGGKGQEMRAQGVWAIALHGD